MALAAAICTPTHAVNAAPVTICEEVVEIDYSVKTVCRTVDISDTGTSTPRVGQAEESNSGSRPSDSPTNCFLRPAISQPKTAQDPTWTKATNFGGSDIGADTILMENFCVTSIEGQSGAPTEWYVGTVGQEPPPPNAQSIANEVVAGMSIPAPQLNFGPDEYRLAVKFPVWISVGNSTSIIDSASDRGLTVTVTAELASLDLGMGEPDVRGEFDPWAPEATVHCDTVPTEGPPDDFTREDVPPCGYTYIWKSLKDRTDDTCRWPITITANWEITWTASNGETGSLSMTRNGATALLVREWRTRLVSPGYQVDRDEWLAAERAVPPCE